MGRNERGGSRGRNERKGREGVGGGMRVKREGRPLRPRKCTSSSSWSCLFSVWCDDGDICKFGRIG